MRRMLARVFSAAVNGIEAFPVEVEVNAGWGETIIVIVGLPDAAVKESRDRVSTALGEFRVQILDGPSHDHPRFAGDDPARPAQTGNLSRVGESDRRIACRRKLQWYGEISASH